MKRSGPGDYYERLERRQVEQLDPELRKLWMTACGSKVAPKLPFTGKVKNMTYKSFGRQAASSRTMTLSVINLLTETSRNSVYKYIGFRDLIESRILHTLFQEQWSKLSARRQWNICRTLWRVAWEFYGISANWLLVGGRRFRAAGRIKVPVVDPTLPGRLLQQALVLAASAERQNRITLRDAIRLRTAAHMAILSELASRLSETALMDIPQLEWDGPILFIITEPQHSKVRKGGRDPVSESVATLINAYLERGRPFLIARGSGVASDALWITRDGVKAEAVTMACALRRETKSILLNGVASGDVRRAAVSQPGQSFSEQWQQLRHVFGSMTAATVYSARDRAEAVRQAHTLSTLTEDDVPNFVQPQPRRTYKSSPR